MKKILLIQTGGTIAMNAKGDGVDLDPEGWSQTLYNEIPELNQIAEVSTCPLFFEDSSDLNPQHWITLAGCVEKHYEQYDGFVILHGTDTMAWSASALSYSLHNLGKPVIFTGSQLPMSSIRSDARRNLVNAIELATKDIPEVGICFNDALYRGCRSTKMSIGDFDAFGSPNYPSLADIGIEIEIKAEPQIHSSELKNTARFSNELFVVTLFPGMDPGMLGGLHEGPLRAVIIRAYGSGNFPVKGVHSMLPFLQKCRETDTIVSIVSQADFDSVDLNKYPAGRKALEHGVLSGGDMTLEAAVTKMMYLLAHHKDQDTVRKHFQKSLAGEVSLS